MKSFLEFITENRKKNYVLATPSHGEHSKPKKNYVLAKPSHGEHADKKKLDEKVHSLDLKGDDFSKPHSDDKVHKDWRHINHNEHLGKGVRDVHNTLAVHNSQWVSHKNAGAIKKYSEWSHDVNQHLIHKAKGTVWDHEHEHKHDEHVHDMDSVLNHSKLSHDVHLFHGTRNYNPGKEAAKHPHGHITLPGYTSTSHDAQQAHRFGGRTSRSKKYQKMSHIIHIHAKKGTKGIHLGEYSEHPTENEVLLHRNTTLKIHPKPDILKHPKTGVTHVWHAHIVDQHKDD